MDRIGLLDEIVDSAERIDLKEKQLFVQRSANMATAQSAYLDKQKAVLGILD